MSYGNVYLKYMDQNLKALGSSRALTAEEKEQFKKHGIARGDQEPILRGNEMDQFLNGAQVVHKIDRGIKQTQFHGIPPLMGLTFIMRGMRNQLRFHTTWNTTFLALCLPMQDKRLD